MYFGSIIIRIVVDDTLCFVDIATVKPADFNPIVIF